LKEIGFIRSKTDQCIYYITPDKSFLTAAIYVDDIFIFYDVENEMQRLIDILKTYFDLKDLVKCLLGT